MKKFFMFLAVFGLIAFAAQYANAQELGANGLSVQTDAPVYQQIKAKFIEGGAGFMGSILLCLIFGLPFQSKELSI